MGCAHQLRRIDWAGPCVLALAALLLTLPCLAAEQAPEYGVKAAFLLNFTKFADWPPAAFADGQAPMQICLLGKDPFGRVLDDLVQGEIVRGHQLTVRRITQPPPPQTCQVLFIDPAMKELRKIVEGLPQGVLTISEGDGFLHNGGMIALVIDNRRVRFDIDVAAVEKAGVKLSSQVLSVARSVTK
jgi:hypothetical protein